MDPSPMGTEASVLGALWDPIPSTSSSGCSSVAFILSSDKLVNVSVSLSSVSHSSKLMEPEVGVVGMSD